MISETENPSEFLTAIAETIRLEWENKNPKMRWLEMETALRDTISAQNRGIIGAVKCISLCDEIIAAFTKRGHCS